MASCGHRAAVAAAEPLGRHAEADELVERQTEPAAARQRGARELDFRHHGASRRHGDRPRGRQLQQRGFDAGFAVEQAIEMGVGERVGGFFQARRAARRPLARREEARRPWSFAQQGVDDALREAVGVGAEGAVFESAAAAFDGLGADGRASSCAACTAVETSCASAGHFHPIAAGDSRLRPARPAGLRRSG